ncbi:HAMP domain-containing sensor histidine kinase, partial [Deinococcus sp.]|uniref:sensor histidine kinase n=1 Tax=Deinococcus sp. TaxID=47478 RepID=UPI0025FA0C12
MKPAAELAEAPKPNQLRLHLPDHWSLRLKLTLGYVTVFAVTVLLGAVLVYFTARGSLTRSLDATLRETASVAGASIERQGAAARFAPELRATRDLRIELLSAAGGVIASVGQTQGQSQDEDRAKPMPLQVGFASVAEQRVLTERVGGGLYLRVSRPSDTLSSLLETLAHILLLGSCVMIVVACAAGYALADRALRPVDAVARTAARIARRGSYHERVPSVPGQDEMARLTGTVNAMLGSLESTIERERSFARTAAHELRTPLSALRGRLELTLERPREVAEYHRALLGMQGRVDALIGLSESLLELARSETPVVLERLELAAEVLAAAEALEEVAAQADKRFELHLSECWVRAEEDGLRRVLLNLIENALKYGSGEVVTLLVGGGACTVGSGGAGPERADWPRLLRAFERGAGRQGTPGSGLGLTLVVALAQRWDAELIPNWP